MLQLYKYAVVVVFASIFSRSSEGLGVLGQQIRAKCFGDDEFLVGSERVNFNNAVKRCAELSAVLGVTFNRQEFDEVRELGFDFGGEIFMGIPETFYFE